MKLNRFWSWGIMAFALTILQPSGIPADELPACDSRSSLACNIACLCPIGQSCDEVTGDCFPTCGNGLIDTGETCLSCPADYVCPALMRCHATGFCVDSCGANGCETASGENCTNCDDCLCLAKEYCNGEKGQCEMMCGNHLCEPSVGETQLNCPQDCFCGNGQCEPTVGETCESCKDCACGSTSDCTAGRCAPLCGNNMCEAEAGETTTTCAEDCLSAICNPVGNLVATAVIRMSRRGQDAETVSATNFPKNPWGPAYDTDDNAANFIVWNNIRALKIHNSASTPSVQFMGKPAGPFGWAQAGDPVSRTVSLERVKSGFRQTTTFEITKMMGSDSIAQELNEFPEFTTTLVAGPYVVQMPPVNAKLPMSGSWGLPFMPPSPWEAPMPCDPSPCDTRQDTIPYPPLAPEALHYGQHPDSKTPYVRLTPPKKPWTLLRLSVVSNSNEPISNVPVIVVDRLNRFPPIEKITGMIPADDPGLVLIVIPANGRFRILINPRRPPKGIPISLHSYRPDFAPRVIPNLVVEADMRDPGETNVIDMSRQKSPVALAAAKPTDMRIGTASIGGVILSDEFPELPLQKMTVYLRDAEGKILKAQKTDGLGRFEFGSLPSGQFFLEPVLRRTWLAIPSRLPIELIEGEKKLRHAFTIRGVPAQIKVVTPTPGTLVIATTKDWRGDGPPDLKKGSTLFVTTASSAENKEALLDPLAGSPYYLTCWVPGPQGIFERRPSQGSQLINDGSSAKPNDRWSTICP